VIKVDRNILILLIMVFLIINPVSAREFDGEYTHLYFNGGTYIDVIEVEDLINNNTNFTIQARFRTIDNDLNQTIFSKPESPKFTISIFDCDIPIESNKTYCMNATINESGKFVTCELYNPLNFTIGDTSNKTKYSGVIDELYFYNKPIIYESKSKTLLEEIWDWLNNILKPWR
jgi:hypothetical protein